MKPKALVIVGPTSSGKSALAVTLAKKFNGEVISADSRQVYRGLTIGTGKITKREMKGVPHHLLDVASPKRKFSADDYIRHARAAIQDISSRGKLPIMAGGTGFYIDALVGRISLPNVPPNPAFRRIHNKSTVGQLFCMLEKSDPERAKTIEPNNKRRLIRALEIALALGKNPTPKTTLEYDVLWVGIDPPLKELEKKISLRLLARMRQGMIAEAKQLHADGLSYKRMEELGLEYRSLAHLLQGAISREQMIEELNRAIRKYAIRQIRYWKRNKEIQWLEKPNVQTISKKIRALLGTENS